MKVGSAAIVAGRLLWAAIPVVALAAVNPFGWDRYGPMRWLLIPAFGFALIAAGLGSLELRQSADTDTEDPGTTTTIAGVPLWTAAWGALLGWGAITSITAADGLHAWIGTPDRRFGWLTWLLCGGLFLVARAAGPIDRINVLRAMAIGSVAMGAYTLAELFNWTAELNFGSRLGGPFGQPAFLGAASALTLPACIGLTVDDQADSKWKLAGGLGATASMFTLLGSQSRAAWLGVLVAGALWLAVAGRTRSADTTGQRRSPSTAVAAALLLSVPAVLAVPDLRARLTSATGDGGVIQGRLDEWRVGARALGQSPIIGYGPEGYRTVFGRHVDEQYVMDWGREVITDRSHSGLLDVGLAFGIPGTLIYLTLAVLVLGAAARIMRTGSPMTVGLAVGSVAYLVQQQFLFPLSELDPLFWLVVGLTVAAGADQPSDHAPGTGSGSPSLGRSLAKGLAVGLTAVVTIAGTLDLIADARTDTAIENGDLSAVTRLRPDSIRYRFIASRVAGRQDDDALALQQVEAGLRRSPHDPALRGERGRLLLDRARATPDGPQRSERLREALVTLEALVADDPNDPDDLQQLGIARALTDDLDGAADALEHADALAPGREDITANLAEVDRLRGR